LPLFFEVTPYVVDYTVAHVRGCSARQTTESGEESVTSDTPDAFARRLSDAVAENNQPIAGGESDAVLEGAKTGIMPACG
jgi:hypothetical protein